MTDKSDCSRKESNNKFCCANDTFIKKKKERKKQRKYRESRKSNGPRVNFTTANRDS